MNFILFELARDMRAALETYVSHVEEDSEMLACCAEVLAVARDAIAKAEAAGVMSRVPATTTE
jgi:hypothetical protein